MRYDLKKYKLAVAKYRKIMKGISKKTVLVELDINQKQAFYSLAPLSMAIHELGADMSVNVNSKKSKNSQIMKDVWRVFSDLKKNIQNKKTKALSDFLRLADKKCKGKISGIFAPPEIVLKAGDKGFEGSFAIPYETSWLREYRSSDLLRTAKVIWDQVYNLKKTEKVSIGFDLVKKESNLGLPLEDYLDSFQISYAMMKAVKNQVYAMGSSSSKKTMMDSPERVSDLKATLVGCEMCKNVNEPVFIKFRQLSKLLRINRLQIASAVFSIHGKGYSGKHYFGECIGYPSKNRKTRWLTPGQMMYKLDYYPQTSLDPSLPTSRIGFTETLPIDIFIKTSNIDWLAMKKRDDKIINITNKCEYIEIMGKKCGDYQTLLKIGLVSKKGRRKFRGSDVETRHLVNPEYRRKGINAGTMANIPGGEAFVTPEYVKGQFIGDVVISIDQSYILSAKEPMVVNCFGNSYKIIAGPPKILREFEEKKQDSWKKLQNHEKSRALPYSVIKINKSNFNNIGELGINTNPEAELCNYLIVNEKIANMIHIALGSGFEPDRATYYHTDIVIDALRQRLDICGVTKDGKRCWIHKKGRLVV